MNNFYNSLANDKKLSIIAGPCVFENQELAVEIAETLKEICDDLSVNFCFKMSFDKANRTSSSSYRGDFDGAYYAFDSIRNRGIPTLTDVHESWQCAVTNADILQIPAFLCRQTDLLKSAAETGKPVNVKKGQFLSPWETKNIVDKIKSFGYNEVMLTERGTTFGYNNLVVDMRSLEVMKEYAPVIMDCTHAVQYPGGQGGSSGGDRRFASVIAYAATAVSIAGLFMEVHPDPDNAPSDGPNMIKLKDFPKIIEQILEIDGVVKK
jgi:2-dehydro-3-deoxyphosphooctonate aldolase (KDO 8-P synthase)